MVPIVQNLVPESMYGYKVISESKGRKWQYITVHNTANDATAANEVSYMRSNTNSTSFHYAVDDTQIVQGILDTMGAFDTSNRAFSSKGLSVEICWSKSGGSKFTTAEKNAAEFIAYKLKEMGYPCDSAHVKQHYDATGKDCPHRTRSLGWDRFMNMIKSYMTEEEDDMTKDEVLQIIAEYEASKEKKAVSDWAKEDWNKAVASGVFDGTMPRSALTREQAAVTYRKLGLLTDGES